MVLLLCHLDLCWLPFLTHQREIDNPEFTQWQRLDKLLKGWITSTLSREILYFVFGLETSHDLWQALKQNFVHSSVEREFSLQGQLQLSKRENFSNLEACLCSFKTICDKLGAIGKHLPEDRKCFWLLHGLGADYQMFTTIMFCPPMPKHTELLDMLHSFEKRILITNAKTTFFASGCFSQPQEQQRSSRTPHTKKEFTSQNKGFQPAVIEREKGTDKATQVTVDSPLFVLVLRIQVLLHQNSSSNARFVTERDTLLIDVSSIGSLTQVPPLI